MKPSRLLGRTAGWALLGASLAVAGCNRATQTADQAPAPTAAMALTDASAPAIVDAPPVSQLPPAPPAPVAQPPAGGDYAYIEQAADFGYGMGEAPPDYTFDYDGYSPWVWRSNDGWQEVVEPMGGGDRYYYYQSGADYPFLIRDADYSYGFNNGALVVVYDHQGHALPWSMAQRQAALAGRDLARARSIYQASQQNQHMAVAAANWQARENRIAAEQAAWTQQQQASPQWASYHQQYWTQDQSHWDDERYRREAEASRTAQMFGDAAAAAVLWSAAVQAHGHAQDHSGPPPAPTYAQIHPTVQAGAAGSAPGQDHGPQPGFAANGGGQRPGDADHAFGLGDQRQPGAQPQPGQFAAQQQHPGEPQQRLGEAQQRPGEVAAAGDRGAFQPQLHQGEPRPAGAQGHPGEPGAGREGFAQARPEAAPRPAEHPQAFAQHEPQREPAMRPETAEQHGVPTAARPPAAPHPEAHAAPHPGEPGQHDHDHDHR